MVKFYLLKTSSFPFQLYFLNQISKLCSTCFCKRMARCCNGLSPQPVFDLQVSSASSCNSLLASSYKKQQTVRKRETKFFLWWRMTSKHERLERVCVNCKRRTRYLFFLFSEIFDLVNKMRIVDNICTRGSECVKFMSFGNILRMEWQFKSVGIQLRFCQKKKF